jgi:small nuclear ribonucleoprotein (snRNP)-like protein
MTAGNADLEAGVSLGCLPGPMILGLSPSSAAANPSPEQRVDFRSPHFDPLSALAVSPPVLVAPPVPNVRPLDNLSKCRPLLPKSSEWHIDVAPTVRTVPQPARIVSRDTALSRIMEEALSRGGPLRLLHRLVTERRRARILVRNVNSIRGTLFGMLIAFDQHMNLVLSDATEIFRDGHNPERSRRKYMKQVLVRGDNIVMVCEQNSSVR